MIDADVSVYVCVRDYSSSFSNPYLTSACTEETDESEFPVFNTSTPLNTPLSALSNNFLHPTALGADESHEEIRSGTAITPRVSQKYVETARSELSTTRLEELQNLILI